MGNEKKIYLEQKKVYINFQTILIAKAILNKVLIWREYLSRNPLNFS